MADYPIAKYATAYEMYTSLVSQANGKINQVNPTLAAGDVVVSKDGGADANITTLPTVSPAGSTQVKIVLSATEMTANNTCVRFKDVAGAEWCDLTINIPTSPRGNNDQVDANLTKILGTAPTEGGAGRLAAGFTKLFDVAVPVFTLASINQGGDSFTRLGAPVGASISADIAAAQTSLNTLLTRLTSARAGYLDNLNVGGTVASHADILNLNQSASRRIIITGLSQFERPEAVPSAYTIEVRTYDEDGAAIDVDGGGTPVPTLTATGSLSGSLAGHLSAGSRAALGVYRWTYTVQVADAMEQIAFDVSATIASSVFTLTMYGSCVDSVALTFTSTYRDMLIAIYNKLPLNNIGDQSLLAALIGTPMQAGNVTLAASQPNYAPSKVGDAMTLTPGERTSIATSVWNALHTSGSWAANSFGEGVHGLIATLTSVRVAYLDSIPGISTVTTKLSGMLSAVGGLWQWTAQALALSPAGEGGSSTTIIVAPLSATAPGNYIVPSGTTQVRQYCKFPAGPIAIVQPGTADPLDMDGGQVRMYCWNKNDATDIFILDSAGANPALAISNNQITVDFSWNKPGSYTRYTYYLPSGGTQWIEIENGFWAINKGPNPASLSPTPEP